MSYLMPRRGRPVAAATLAVVCLLVAAAPQAWADGEDDPTFGNVGTSFVPLGEFAPIGDPDTGGPMRPRTDQAPDGAVISAVALQPDPLGARSVADVLRVVRMDASGTPAGLDGDGSVDIDYGFIRRLLDVEALADGRIILVTQSVSSAGSRGGNEPVEIRTLDASGTEVGSGTEFFSPEDCMNSNGQARAADVDATGKVFVGWDNCKGDAVLARYDGDDDLTRTMPVENVRELTLGPDSLVYVLSDDPGNFKRGIFGGSLVTRYETSNLELDDEYGDEGVAEINQTSPIDFTVGPNGSAVVWAQPFGLGRGSGPDTWDLYRLGDDGELDHSWSGDGHAEVSHPALGYEFSNPCRTRVRVCGAERPQVIAQGDNKIIAVGYPPEQQQEQTPLRGSEGPPAETDRTIIRLTENGALDASWDGDGVRSFTLGQPPDGAAEYMTLGPPTLQSDGKLLIALFTQAGQAPARVPAPPEGVAIGVSRIGLTPPGAAPVVQQQAASVAAAVPVAVAVANRSCVSRRVFRIRLRTGRRKAERSAIKTVSVTVNGKKVPVTKGARRRAQVDLRNLPKGRFTVVIRMTLADRGKVRDTRRYRTCAPKQARELPGLRTRKPRRR